MVRILGRPSASALLRSAAAAAILMCGVLVIPHAAGASAGSVLLAPSAPAPRLAIGSTPTSPWSLGAATTIPSSHADQGVAALIQPRGTSIVVTRGRSDIPPALRSAGWVHIGDPGASGGYLIDAYQGGPGATSKMFAVTAPNGRRALMIHRLSPGELYNNSFAAVSPDGRWLVSGEWGTMSRLLVFRLPALSEGMRTQSALPLAAVVTMSHPMRDVQGCAFDSPTVLVCATNDPGSDLYPQARQLLEVSLAHPLDGALDVATPSYLAAVPQWSVCRGAGETEGVDLTQGTLRVMVVEPGACRAWTGEYAYARGRL